MEKGWCTTFVVNGCHGYHLNHSVCESHEIREQTCRAVVQVAINKEVLKRLACLCPAARNKDVGERTTCKGLLSLVRASYLVVLQFIVD